jgi:hypothetical protein
MNQMDLAVQGANLFVGTRIKAMLIQILTYRKALYGMQEWFAKQDVELLLGPGITSKSLNDDAFSRALDHLHRIDFDTLFTFLSLLDKPATSDLRFLLFLLFIPFFFGCFFLRYLHRLQ